MKECYKDLIGIYENAFSKDFCDYLINIGEKNISTLGKERDDIQKSMDINDVSFSIADIWSPKDEEYFFNALHTSINLYFTNYKAIGYPVGETGYDIIDTKFQKTKPFQGYNMYHTEYSPYNEHQYRFGVYTLYLNDIKEGGETEFLYQGYRLSPKAGTVCIFPAYFTHMHRGNPPFKETKYILTGWLEFPPSNNNNNNN